MSAKPLTDHFGRTARYLRLSVTDRCNLRCRYCRNGPENFIGHDDILRYEEMLVLADIAVDMGIEKIRLTGGEPFVRKGCMALIEKLRARHPRMELRLTTNATLLAQYINGLRDLGIQAMNVSLDTLRQKRFYNITGRDLWPVVMSNIEKLIKCGFKLKINAVAMRGVNSDELPDFIALARQNPVDVRFIEIMPIGKDGLWSKDMFWSANDILREAETLADLSPQKIADRHAGPARMYSINGGAGRIGLISPLSGHFCMGCNRLRISADGRLRTCLFSDRQYRLRGILRHAGLGEKAARRVIAAANNKKPIGRDIFDAQGGPTQRMTAIGG